MRIQLLATLALVSCGALLAGPAPLAHEDGRWDAPQLKKSLGELGYEPKELTETKWEVKLTKAQLNVPVGSEVSPSGNYIWLTARLGEAPSDEKAGRLLRRNAKIQPTQFYITEKGALMVGICCENRAMTNAILRKALEKITDDVVATAEEWGK